MKHPAEAIAVASDCRAVLPLSSDQGLKIGKNDEDLRVLANEVKPCVDASMEACSTGGGGGGA